ncbi:MAG TPA: DUF6069 family protein [Nocardioides sp.]|nr:DUF6069 family protein [Nocardioides sp.]
MSVSTVSTTAAPSVTHAARPAVWRHGLAAAVGATAATTAVAAIASAAGVSFADRTGASIPISGFAVLTDVFSLIGVAIAAVVARRARSPRRTFLRITGTLVVLSLVPDLVSGFDAASALTLMADHLVAAAIVVPVLARRLVVLSPR